MTSAELLPRRDLRFTPRGQEEFLHAGPTVQDAIERLLMAEPGRYAGYRDMPGNPGWRLGRAGYLDFAFRWLTPQELTPLKYEEHADVALVHRVGEIRLPREAFTGPALAAAAALAAGLAFAPDHMDLASHRQLYGAFFGTTAQVVATLFVALALGVGQATIRTRFYRLTVAYVAIGLVAALIASSPGLPEWSYRLLLALGLAGGAGALVSTALVAFWAVEERSDAQAPPAPP